MVKSERESDVALFVLISPRADMGNIIANRGRKQGGRAGGPPTLKPTMRLFWSALFSDRRFNFYSTCKRKPGRAERSAASFLAINPAAGNFVRCSG